MGNSQLGTARLSNLTAQPVSPNKPALSTSERTVRFYGIRITVYRLPTIKPAALRPISTAKFVPLSQG